MHHVRVVKLEETVGFRSINELKDVDRWQEGWSVCGNWEHFLYHRSREAPLGSSPAPGLLESSATGGKGMLGWIQLCCGLKSCS